MTELSLAFDSLQARDIAVGWTRRLRRRSQFGVAVVRSQINLYYFWEKRWFFISLAVGAAIMLSPLPEGLTENGIIGDKQADLSVHGGFEKAIYAYSYSHYKSWSEQMGKDYSNDYGLVGENLTIDDFDEKNLYIGDEVTISNCILKITQPRIPCFKLGIKMNDRKFPQLFSQSGNVGAYMKVLTPGKISKGDEIIITRQESSSMTVYEIMYLLYKDKQNTDQMKRALEISSLTEDIKEKFRERLLKLGDYSSL